MAVLYLIRGAPGSGKTTLARTLMKKGLVRIHNEADQFMVDRNAQYKFDLNRLAYCHQRCRESIQIYIQSGYSGVVSNCFARRKHIEPYMTFSASYQVKIIELRTHYQNIHSVPPEKVSEIRRSMQYLSDEWLNQWGIPVTILEEHEVQDLVN